jgi:hypothetical protein
VWCRAQSHHLGTEFDQAVVPIMGNVAQGNMNGHAGVFQQGIKTMNSLARALPSRPVPMLASLAPDGHGCRPRSLRGRSASAATDGEKSHFAPVFPAVATATVLKSRVKLDSFPTRFALMPSAAQAPSPNSSDGYTPIAGSLRVASSAPQGATRAALRKPVPPCSWAAVSRRLCVGLPLLPEKRGSTPAYSALVFPPDFHNLSHPPDESEPWNLPVRTRTYPRPRSA